MVVSYIANVVDREALLSITLTMLGDAEALLFITLTMQGDAEALSVATKALFASTLLKFASL